MNFPLVKCNWACLRMPFGSAFYFLPENQNARAFANVSKKQNEPAQSAEKILVEEK